MNYRTQGRRFKSLNQQFFMRMTPLEKFYSEAMVVSVYIKYPTHTLRKYDLQYTQPNQKI